MTNSPTVADRLMNLFWRKPADTLAERTRRRVTLHLIPFLFFLYILAYLDRVNVSVAMLGMQNPPNAGGLGLSNSEIGSCTANFFWGYWILEIPSTLIVVRWGARWVFARVLVLWGICAILPGLISTPAGDSLFGWLPHLSVDGSWPVATIAEFVNNLRDSPKHQFAFLQFMLGFFEGGFFPSVIVYLSLWFRPQDRAKAVAGFMAAIPISIMVGSWISTQLLGVHWFGLTGWRWIFILEGAAPIVAGIATLFVLPDRPTVARWLPTDEREWLADELAAEAEAKKGHSHWEWVHHLGLVFLLTVVYFGQNVISYGLVTFMPAIIRSQSGFKDDQLAAFVASLPFAFGFIGMWINGWHSDRTGERFCHAAAPMALLGLAVLAAALLDRVPVVPVLVMILCVGPVMYAHLPAFWPIPSTLLGSFTAAAAIGFINMVGNLGGGVGRRLVGDLAQNEASFATALMWLAPWPIMSATVVLGLGWWQSRRRHADEVGRARRAGA